MKKLLIKTLLYCIAEAGFTFSVWNGDKFLLTRHAIAIIPKHAQPVMFDKVKLLADNTYLHFRIYSTPDSLMPIAWISIDCSRYEHSVHYDFYDYGVGIFAKAWAAYFVHEYAAKNLQGI